MVMDYQALLTMMKVLVRYAATTKPSFQATSLTAVGTSQSGVWMCIAEVVAIMKGTPLISKSGDHHHHLPTQWALDSTIWLETTGLPLFP